VVTNTLKIMRATMLLSATSIGVGMNVRLVGCGLSIFRYQGIYTLQKCLTIKWEPSWMGLELQYPQYTLVSQLGGIPIFLGNFKSLVRQD
jgi:hypothetical protein